MKTKDLQAGLREDIARLELKQTGEGILLKAQFHVAVDSMKPINLIKNTFREATASRDMKDSVVSTGVGLVAGFLTKVIIRSVMKSPVNRLIGNVAMFGVTKLFSNNPDRVHSLGKGLRNILTRMGGSRDHKK